MVIAFQIYCWPYPSTSHLECMTERASGTRETQQFCAVAKQFNLNVMGRNDIKYFFFPALRLVGAEGWNTTSPLQMVAPRVGAHNRGCVPRPATLSPTTAKVIFRTAIFNYANYGGKHGSILIKYSNNTFSQSEPLFSHNHSKHMT